MKIVSAIDSFKGSMTSKEISEAFSRGIKKIIPTADVEIVPIADGGEGTVEALVYGTNGKMIQTKVTNPLFEEVDSFYGILGDHKTAVIEMAAASGLPLIPLEKRNPLFASSVGTGELILKALHKGCRKFIIGIGGSATSDCGIGMLYALGYDFLDKDNNKLRPIAKSLNQIAHINTTNVPSELFECEFLIACDVENPLFGLNGAAHVYGKQKGATLEIIEELDEGARHFSKIVKKIGYSSFEDEPGSGAAGGLGFAFLTFLPAKLASGIGLVIEALKLEDKIKDADYVITGEGRIDFQSAMGKTPVGVSKIAQRYGIPVIGIGGSIDKEVDALYDSGITALFSIMDHPMTLDEAMDNKNALSLVEKQAENIFRLIASLN